jgi:hypothetical protein
MQRININVTDVFPEARIVEDDDGNVLSASDMAEARRLAKAAARRTRRKVGIYTPDMTLVALVTPPSIR